MFNPNYMACRIEEKTRDNDEPALYVVRDADDQIILTMGTYDDEDTIIVWEGNVGEEIKEFGPSIGVNWKAAFHFLYAEACRRLLEGEDFFDETEAQLTYEERLEEAFPTEPGMIYLSLRNYGEKSYDLGGFYSKKSKAFESAMENVDIGDCEDDLAYYQAYFGEAYPIGIKCVGKKGDTVTVVFDERDPEDMEMVLGIPDEASRKKGYVYITAVLGKDNVSYSREAKLPF